MGWISIHFIDS